MNIQEWLEQGNLTEALAQARRDVSAGPDNAGLRFLLFELLALEEDFDGAESELREAATRNASLSEAVSFYAGLLEAERKRRKLVLQGEGDPPVALHEPPAYSGVFLQALALLAGSDPGEAKGLLDEAWRSVPRVSGLVDGERFADLRDADDVLGPFLEVVVPGQYLWIPFAQIKRLDLRSPRGYQDVIWIPAYLETREGARGDLWVPSLYCGTARHGDYFKLGRMTGFEYPAGVARGHGQRDLKIDGNTLKGIRQVTEVLFD